MLKSFKFLAFVTLTSVNADQSQDLLDHMATHANLDGTVDLIYAQANDRASYF